MLLGLVLGLLASAGGGLTLGLGDITPQGQVATANGALDNYLSRFLCSLTACDASTFCQLGRCWPKLPRRAVCGNSLVCASGNCINGRCAGRLRPATLGGSLGPIIIRLPGLTAASTTSPPAGGTTGATTAATAATTTTAPTPAPPVCLTMPICDTATTFCDINTGMCTSRMAVGENCDFDDQCDSRLCLDDNTCGCASDGNCAEGETCNTDTNMCEAGGGGGGGGGRSLTLL